MKRQKILFVIKFSFSCLPSLSGVKNKKLNNGLILTGKYVVQIYKIKLHTKNYIDQIKKNEVPSTQRGLKFDVQPDTRILVTGLHDPVDISKKF